ncbi:MAG: hypothetical protein OEZ59_12210 [Deltaproteobacteria bacterium]|nr:hypothetical protein [Deltaproteobacteria bacterium]
MLTDTNNNRIPGRNTFPTSNAQAVDVVIGQADFSRNDGVGSLAPMGCPWGLRVTANQLIVNDTCNDRYQIFNGQ